MPASNVELKSEQRQLVNVWKERALAALQDNRTDVPFETPEDYQAAYAEFTASKPFELNA